MTQLARMDRPDHLAVVTPTAAAPIARLDPYAGGLVDIGDRIDPLAVISFGYRDEPRGANKVGYPKAARPGDAKHIHIHDPQGRAPGLAQALADRQGRTLLIAFPWDDPALIVQQRFTRYSASRLEAYGDDQALVWIDAGNPDANPPKPASHRRFEAGTPEYDRLVKTCKADTRIYFCLAEWTDDGSDVVFPDGMGVYALRTTSRHTVRSILQSIAYMQRFTRGAIRGIPWELALDFREVAGPDGSKRTIPVGTITNRPPQGMRLSARTFQRLTTQALEMGSALMLPAPAEPTVESFEQDGPAWDTEVLEPSTEQLATLEQGGLCNATHWTRMWHALARGTAFESDAARADFIREWCGGWTGSLAELLGRATEAQASQLIADLGVAIGRQSVSERAARYDAIFEDEDAPAPPVVNTPTPAAAEPDDEVTSARDDAWGDYAELVMAYQQAGGDMSAEPALAELPIPRKVLAAKGERLRAWVAEHAEPDQEALAF